MAALRNTTKLLRNVSRAQGALRTIATKPGSSRTAALRPLLVGGLTLGAASYLGYKHYSKGDATFLKQVYASTHISPQPSVISGTKDHALYLTIHLKPDADVKACSKVLVNLQKYVASLFDPSTPPDEDDEVIAGVGFGPNTWAQVAGKTKKNYTYPHRKGSLGDMPSTGGDIFIHAKSNKISKLFELAQKLMKELPKGSVDRFEDIYGWVYKEGRDLSGFIDGTENPADDELRYNVAVEKETGGSYVIAQKWVHDHDAINSIPTRSQEQFVGRAKEDSVELKRKPITSHVARMTGGATFEQKKVFQIVRQSQPYGTVSGESGLFFIGYAESPENFEYMLDRMVGAGGDGHSDDVMRLTKCVKGTYWYFPSPFELKKLM